MKVMDEKCQTLEDLNLKGPIKRVGEKYIKVGELESVEFFPPNDHCGWYGLVIKPKWMPKWLAWPLRNHLKIELGWLNVPRKDKDANYSDLGLERWWFIYPQGHNRTNEDGSRAESIQVKPFLWCEIVWGGQIVDINGKVLRNELI